MSEWDLLTSLVTASNNEDEATVYQLIADTDFSDKPMATSAALFAIDLVPKNVESHKEVLTAFATNIADVDKDFREAMRFYVLKDLLGMK